MKFFQLLKNIFRLNNLKHIVTMQQEQLQNQQKDLQSQQEQFQSQQEQFQSQQELLKLFHEQLQNQQQEINDIQNSIDAKVAKQISYQSVSFQQRIDQFIHDTKIDLKNEKL